MKKTKTIDSTKVKYYEGMAGGAVRKFSVGRFCLSPYSINLHVCVGDKDSLEYGVDLRGKHFRLDDAQGVTFVNRVPDQPFEIVVLLIADDHPTFVHEAGHVVLRLFEYIGMKADTHTGEAFCYMLGQVYDHMVKVNGYYKENQK